MYARIHSTIAKTSSVCHVQKYIAANPALGSPSPVFIYRSNASDSGQFASIANTVNPFSFTRYSSIRCFIWKISRVPCVASPSATTRASPTAFPNAAKSPFGLPASTVCSGTTRLFSSATTAVAKAGSVGGSIFLLGPSRASRNRQPPSVRTHKSLLIASLPISRPCRSNWVVVRISTFASSPFNSIFVISVRMLFQTTSPTFTIAATNCRKGCFSPLEIAVASGVKNVKSPSRFRDTTRLFIFS